MTRRPGHGPTAGAGPVAIAVEFWESLEQVERQVVMKAVIGLGLYGVNLAIRKVVAK